MDPKTELSEQEVVALEEFKHRIRDLLPGLNEFRGHDLGLIRFIRARECDLDKAEDMFRKHMQWRKEKNIDNVWKLPIRPEIEEKFPIKFCGFDTSDHPVVLVPVGKYDIRRAIESGDKEEFLLLAYKLFELSLDICKLRCTENKYVSQIFAILDFEGFSFFQLASRDVIDLCIAIVKTFEANYPEILKIAVVINAPKVFQVLWAVVKPLLTKRTLAKIHIHGGNKDSWKEVIFQQINPQTFCSEYGGANTTVPTIKFNEPKAENQIPDTDFTLFGEKEFKKIQLGARQKHEISINASPGSVLEWNFTTDQYDIGFQVLCDGDQDVVNYCRVDSDVFLQRGKVKCNEAGKYTFIFDNSFSAFKGKALNYVIKCTSVGEKISVM